MLDPKALFQQFGGSEDAGYMAVHAPVQHTPDGTPYLTHPGVVVLARPQTNLAGLAGFLSGYGEASPFLEYLDDPTRLPEGAQLCKVAGQLCYMSFGRKRSFNKQAGQYFDNLKASGHGSVLEHANYSLLLYGISRSVTHELIRHRAGMSYCLAGDTLIYGTKWDHGHLSRLQKYRLEDLYAMTRTPYGRSCLKSLRLRCLDEQSGTFAPGKVKSILCSGVKPVFKVTLSDGKTITSTKEHRFLTKDGWMPLEDVVGGLRISATGHAIYEKADAEIMVNGQAAPANAEWSQPHALAQRLFQREAAIDGLSSTKRPTARRMLIPKSVSIASVIYAGEQMTYDIEMEGPNHNFIANGIITHNSQQSQRYVSGRMVRFVERPEYAIDGALHAQFLQRIDRAAAEYASITERILEMQHSGTQLLSADERTDLRKKVQQTARSVLPNETEAPIVVTGNTRAWRHIISMRASAHAETEIRELAVRIFLCLYLTDPILFGDYTLEKLSDGTFTARTAFEKV